MWEFWIDRGGTFTDIIAKTPDNHLVGTKVLSENPDLYADAPSYGIKKILEKYGISLAQAKISSIKMGTTVSTNALLQRKGRPTLLIVTKGMGDALLIGDQSRPDIFALEVIKEAPLYHTVLEVEERLSAHGEVISPLNEDALIAELQKFFSLGLRSCAVVCMHGYRFHDHEQKIARLAEKVGFTEIVCSHKASPLQRLIPRGQTTVLNAYLNPVIKDYLTRFQESWKEQRACPIEFMQSNGGLCSAEQFEGKNSLFSGPAGGVIGAVKAMERLNIRKVVAFDMGGTSTDVSHYGGRIERLMELSWGGLKVQAPHLAIHTVAAGGGSLVKFDQGRYQVGPESAGANPGPACYGRGGPATITDCNLILGRLVPEAFPKIFGQSSLEGLNKEASLKVLKGLHQDVNDGRSWESMAEAYLDLGVFNMANAIRKITVEKGIDLDGYTLCSLGSASGQVICKIAEELGLDNIVIHPMAGLLSAYGIGNADKTMIFTESVNQPLSETQEASLSAIILRLQEDYRARYHLGPQGKWFVRYYLRSHDSQAQIPVDRGSLHDMTHAFEAAFFKMFGFKPDRSGIQLELIELEYREEYPYVDYECQELESKLECPKSQKIFHKGRYLEARIMARSDLGSESVSGPVIILDRTGTNVIDPGWRVRNSPGGLILNKEKMAKKVNGEFFDSKRLDPFKVELFGRLFQQIAERMGLVLQRTSRSVNIRERLDFSCAIFDERGHLVANAPHIPVHLGSMSASVQSFLQKLKGQLRPGDAYIHNNPYTGGTHLPDLTIISPVFYQGDRPDFYVAARGHHADIGGITPGSMPAFSKTIGDEGIVFDHDLIMRDGEFFRAKLEETLLRAKHPARRVETNISDIKAQIAANQKAIIDIIDACDRYGPSQIKAYMKAIQDNAAQTFLSYYEKINAGHAVIHGDEGLVISCRVVKNQAEKSLVFDFSGSSQQQASNFNAPMAVVRAAVLYSMRCLVAEDIPLNDGLLHHLDFVIPQGSCLSPQHPAAVVAGNVELSQLLVDAVLSATGQLAHSQGTMNNLTFGNESFQYYETICGGMGAGPHFNGASAVQSHMTNSRLTDPEVLESECPIRIETFAIRHGSGGSGGYQGGDGIIRAIRFLEAMEVGMISSRRASRPQGLQGGCAGKSGINTLLKLDGQKVSLGACFLERVGRGDILLVKTPGGGGFGPPPIS